MRIAFFHNLPVGGARRVVYEEIVLLAKEHEVDLYTLKNDEKDFLNFATLPCTIFYYNFKLNANLGFFNRILNDLKTFIFLPYIHKKIADDINKKNYDTVIIHPDKYTQAPYLLRFITAKKIYFCEELLRMAYEPYFSLTNLPFLNFSYELLNRKVRKHIDASNARSANVILANSNYIRQKAEKAYNKKVFTCYLGVDTRVFKPSQQKKKYILFIGNPEKLTGSRLLESLPANYKSILYIVDFTKHFVSDKSLADLYSKSYVTLCLSFEEPFGLTAIESFACQTPVIAVNEGGYKESVMNNKNGFLINRDSDELINKITFLIQNQEKRKNMGEYGEKFVKKAWTWENHITVLKKYL